MILVGACAWGAACSPAVAQDSGADAAPSEKSPGKVIPMSVEEAVRLALARNFQVRLSELGHRITQREVVVQRAVFDPFLTLGSTYSKNRRPTASFLDIGGGALSPRVQTNPFETMLYSAGINGRTVLGTNYSISLSESGFDRPLGAGSLYGFNPQQSTSVRAVLTQPLLKGAWYPFNSGQLRIALNNERLAREDLESVTSDLIYQVESAYWSLVFSTQNFEATKKALEVAREDLEKAQKEEAAGTKARIFVTTVKAQLRLREVDFNDAQLSLENTRDVLLEILNHGGDSLKQRWEAREDVGPYDDVTVEPTSDPDTEPFEPDRDVSLSLAFQNRADYRRFDIQLESQQILVDLARNDLLPRVDLTSTWEQLGLDNSIEGSFSSLGSGQFHGWSVGLQIELPLSNRGPKNAYRRSQDVLRQMSWDKMRVENQIVVQVDQSIRRLASLWRKVQFLDDVVTLKQQELDAERRKLAAGTSIPFTVHTLENDLIAQQTNALQARADYLTARAEYYMLTGVLLERYDVDLDP